MTDIRAYSLDFLSRATNGAAGVSRGSAPYERVTEGRHTQAVQIKKFYSACGDLAQALLFAVGIRDKRFINRKENGNASGDPYKIGWNVVELNALALAMRDYSKLPICESDAVARDAGDITIVWNRADTTDAHVAVVRSVGPMLEHLLTSDYGQGAPLDGKQCRRKVDGILLGQRKLQRVIPLVAAVERFATSEPIPLDVYFGPASAEPAQTLRPILLLGSRGDAVKELQTRLNAKGAALLVDGSFGPKTDNAVTNFQRAHGLHVDGIVGQQTWAKLL